MKKNKKNPFYRPTAILTKKAQIIMIALCVLALVSISIVIVVLIGIFYGWFGSELPHYLTMRYLWICLAVAIFSFACVFIGLPLTRKFGTKSISYKIKNEKDEDTNLKD